jgi:transcriptional regulator with XRE-family HTH domain
MDSAAKTWGKALRERRRFLRLSQQQVANLTGKAQSQIARIESGREDARLSSVVQVARSLGLDLVPVPVRLLPAVRHLLHQHGAGTPGAASRLVGNDPEDVEAGRG